MGKKTLWAGVLVLIIVLAFFEFTNVDLIIQTALYNPITKSWFIHDPTRIYHTYFYTRIKFPIYFIGISSLIALGISYKKKNWLEYRKGLIIVVLTLIILPSSIALIGKKITNVQCPDDLTNFGASIPYVKLFESYPRNPLAADGKWFPGHCFPAGHSSGGFALLSFYCFFKRQRNKNLALIIGLTMGFIMSGFQMLRGVHFLSHNIVTMLLAIILISTLNLLIKDFTDESSQLKK